MPLVLGIDEAGYGPVLGPLVIGATLWRMQPAVLDGDHWACLDGCICRTVGKGEARLPVGDSKKLFDRKRGLCTLERSVLAFAHAAGLQPGTVGELLLGLGFDGAPRAFPWYRDFSRAIPVDPARSAFAGIAGRLAQTMQAAGLACSGLRAEIITEDAFNRRVRQTRNKATVVCESVLRLIYWAAQQARDQDLHVFVDRLGGRANYRQLLMDAFPERHLHVVELGDGCSRYRLAGRRSDWHITFLVDGDEQQMPVALASMTAKYVRELLMEQFNAYWHTLAPAVRPTAGYYQDAQRFLAEIEPVVAQSGVPAERFVRAR